jgi:flagellar hook-basal body complex protein FliE
MDLKVTGTPLHSTAVSGLRPGGPARPAGTAAVGGDESQGFSAALRGALQSVSAAQNKSQALQREVQLENPAVSLEETMVAIQKAQIGFQAAVHVRNRLVQAYSDIMNMQV